MPMPTDASCRRVGGLSFITRIQKCEMQRNTNKGTCLNHSNVIAAIADGNRHKSGVLQYNELVKVHQYLIST